MNRRKLVVTILLVLGAGGYGLFHWAEGPATSRPTVLPAQNSGDVLGDNIVLKPWQTGFFQTRIPDSLQTKTSDETTGRPVLASYLLTGTGAGASDQTAVTIGRLTNSPLAGVSAVALRLQLPSTYVPVTLTQLPAGSYAFERSDHTELAVLWQHGSEYVALATTTAPSRFSEQRQTVTDMLDSWQWPGQAAGVLQ